MRAVRPTAIIEHGDKLYSGYKNGCQKSKFRDYLARLGELVF